MSRTELRLVDAAARNQAQPEVPGASSAELLRKTHLCLSALAEARRQIAAQRLGPVLSQLLARACELQDEMDEMLLGLDPTEDSDAFARAAALHRTLQEVESLLPREFRRRPLARPPDRR